MPERFLLLDRDGTLIVEKGYLSDPDQVELIPGAAQVLRQLQSIGWGIAIVTNQAGIGRGYYTLRDMQSVNFRLAEILRDSGVEISGFYFCPHHPDSGCRCRKPKPEMVERAAAELGFDPKTSVLVGDKASDIELGRAVGAVTVLVRTGYGSREEQLPDLRPDFVIDSLSDLAKCIEPYLATDST